MRDEKSLVAECLKLSSPLSIGQGRMAADRTEGNQDELAEQDDLSWRSHKQRCKATGSECHFVHSFHSERPRCG